MSIHVYTALWLAAKQGHFHIVDWLAGQGADVNAIDKVNGNTPLHEAVMMENKAPADQKIATIKYLLELGASTESQNQKGQTVVDIMQEELPEALELLEHITISGQLDQYNKKQIIGEIQPSTAEGQNATASQNLDCTSASADISSAAVEATDDSAAKQEDATTMSKETDTQSKTESASSISQAEPTIEKAIEATAATSTSEPVVIQHIPTTTKLPAVAKVGRPYCPVHSHTGRIAEPFESAFKAKYGEELYETIFQTFLGFDASLNKMNREIQLNKVSHYPKKVYQLIKQLPLFQDMCKIDQQLKDTHKCDEGLKAFLHFAAQRHKDGGLILLICTTHEVPQDVKYHSLCYFDSPDQFLSSVNAEENASTESTPLAGELCVYQM